MEAQTPVAREAQPAPLGDAVEREDPALEAGVAEDVAAGKLAAADITPARFEMYLDTAGLPPPDILVRTSGELRLSNFMLWQAAYTELVFTDVLWPDFNKEALEAATGGRWRVTIQRNDNEREMVESVQIGTLDCTITSTGPVGNFVPEVRAGVRVDCAMTHRRHGRLSTTSARRRASSAAPSPRFARSPPAAGSPSPASPRAAPAPRS